MVFGFLFTVEIFQKEDLMVREFYLAKYPEEAILVFRAPEEFSKMSLEKQQESLETIGYIGEFSDGKESGKGIRFDYPNLNQYFQLMAISNYEEASALDKKVNVYIGKFKKGEMNGSFKVYRDGVLVRR